MQLLVIGSHIFCEIIVVHQEWKILQNYLMDSLMLLLISSRGYL